MCRAKIKQLKREELPFVYLMMLLSNVENHLLSKQFQIKNILFEVLMIADILHFISLTNMLWNRYYETYLPFLLEACNDESPDVCQVCMLITL